MSPSREYELILMLDPELPEERREQIASEARTRIESGGSLKHDTTWGMRKLAYEIEQRTEADYRFFRFETEGGLLDDLNHNLRIADGVLRFRVFKVDPRSPAIAPPAPMATAAATPARGGRRGREPAAAEAAESAQGDGATDVPEPTADEEPAASPAEEAESPAEDAAGEPAEDAAGEPAEDAAGEEPPQAAEQDSEPEASA